MKPKINAFIIGFLILLSSFILSEIPLLAGPPFITDDPEPVDYRHWEVYLASQDQFQNGSQSSTLPHVEVNYGIVQETQIHIIVPYAYSSVSGGPRTNGLGDIELGFKYRFIHETCGFPQVGAFPLIELPTGDESLGLGAGHTSVFIPLWFQKSYGSWTAFAGGGYWFNNSGDGDVNYWQTGTEIQKDLSKRLTLGAELFYFSRRTEGGDNVIGINAGGIYNFSEREHMLLSVGKDLSGPDVTYLYAAFQLTIGPK